MFSVRNYRYLRMLLELALFAALTVAAFGLLSLAQAAQKPAAKSAQSPPAEARPDGSVYKMVRYGRAGYFVVYSRTSGDSPLVNVTMQKILD
jgi:hypothetical protein